MTVNERSKRERSAAATNVDKRKVTDDPNGTNPGGFTVNPDGTISVAAGTISGTYMVEYQICENGASPANCDIATATVVVENVIDAMDDDYSGTPIAEGGSTPDVTDNDTLNGLSLIHVSSCREATVCNSRNGPNHCGITVNPDGTLSVAAGTPTGN